MGHVAVFSTSGKESANTEHMWRARKIDWFWQPIKAYWPGYAEILICSLFINLFTIALPIFTMNIYDRVVPNFAVDTLQVLTIGIILAFLFDFLFRTIRAHILEKIAARLSTRFDHDLMERLIEIPGDAAPFTVGEKANIFRELQSIRDFYASRLVPAFVDLPFALLFIGVIYLIAPAVAFVPIAGIVVILLANTVVQIMLTRRTKEVFSAGQAKSSFMVETLSGIETLKTFNAGGHRLQRWHDLSSKAAQASRKNQVVTNAAAHFSTLTLYMVNVFVLFFGVYAIQSGALTIGGLIAVTILSGRSVSPIIGTAGVVARLKQSADVLKTLDKLFAIPLENERAGTLSAKGPFTGNIQVHNASYRYPDQSLPAITDVTLNIKAGERIGLIGQTGAGKSTLAKLIAGIIQPQNGTVLYDNYAQETILPAELRRYVGYVPQKSFFFNGTIRDNILMGNESITPEELSRATHLSGLDMYIQQTGQGFDTEIGEGGNRLSGGQQQAISLARALVRNPSILIFDEPTTGMDSTLEQIVQKNLQEFLKGRTFIMVTHRTTLLPLVDRLVLLTKGRINADGKRDDIMKQLGGTPPKKGGRS